MKTFIRIALGLSVILAVMTSCEDNLEFSRKVRFSAAGGYQNGPKTKTAYSDKEYDEGTKTYERIDWVEGDLLKIVSDVATTETGASYADYEVVDVSGTTPPSRISNAEVENADDNGLNWGPGTNTFYALYPSPSTTSMGMQAGVDISTTATGATFTGVIPRNQSVTLRDTVYQPVMNYAYMWAATATTATDNVDLAFQPAMTALEFTICNPESTLMKVMHLRLRALNNGTALTGTFTGTINKTNLDACEYTCPTGTDDNRYIDIDFSPALEIPGEESKSVTALALPQDLTGLTVVLTLDGGETRTLELKNSSGEWYTFGATKKYHIILGVPTSYDYTFVVTKNMSNPPYTGYIGSDADYTVTSYRALRGSGYKTGVAWTAEFSTDGGTTWSTTKPAWLTEFTSSQTGRQAGTTAKPYRAQVRAITGHNAHSDILKNRGDRGSEDNPWDLSKHTIAGASSTQNTANCYVVDRPGWYMLPLVYGNAIKAGGTNTNSYDPDLTGNSTTNQILKPFKNHANNNITGPNITTTITKAGLVWQDAEDLVSRVQLQGTNYIKFYVSAETICQGNAVIAAYYDNSDVTAIAWSWHIWVTDQNLAAKSVTWSMDGTSITQSFMPYNLGWCEGGSVTWTARNVRIRFKQEGSNETQTFNINQSGHTQTLLGNSPYYQWGRKDPQIPSKGDASNTSDNKTWYDGSGATYISGRNIIVRESTRNLGWAIRRPNTIILNPDASNHNWCSTNWINLWNSSTTTRNQSVTSTGKTIYDPCPPGYVVPSPGMFPPDNNLASLGDTYSPDDNWYAFGGMTWPVLGCRLRIMGTAPSYNDGGQTITGYGNYSGGYGKLMTSVTMKHSDDTSAHYPEQTYNVIFGAPKMTESEGAYAKHIGLMSGMGKASAGCVRCVPE